MGADSVIGWVLTLAHQLRLRQAKTLANLVEAATLSAIGRCLAGDASSVPGVSATTTASTSATP